MISVIKSYHEWIYFSLIFASFILIVIWLKYYFYGQYRKYLGLTTWILSRARILIWRTENVSFQVYSSAIITKSAFTWVQLVQILNTEHVVNSERLQLTQSVSQAINCIKLHLTNIRVQVCTPKVIQDQYHIGCNLPPLEVLCLYPYRCNQLSFAPFRVQVCTHSSVRAKFLPRS